MNSQMTIEQLASLNCYILPENLPVEKWVRIPAKNKSHPNKAPSVRVFSDGNVMIKGFTTEESLVYVPKTSGKSPEEIEQIKKEQAERQTKKAKNCRKAVLKSSGNAEVLFAFGSGNVSESEMVIARGNDFKTPVNIGKENAGATARLVNASYSIPKFSGEENGSDWNDRFLLDMAGGKSC